jgi:hypothetical protein
VKNLYYADGANITDHGRVNRSSKIKGKKIPTDWLTRVDAQSRMMLAKIDALPDGCPYQEELRRGALAISHLSKACGLQLGAKGKDSFLADWKVLDPDSFKELRGRDVLGARTSKSR